MDSTTATAKIPEPDNGIQPTKLTDHHHHHPKILSFTNGVLKRHHHHRTIADVALYKECLKNHAASLGGHALDGCGEFMPSPTSTPTDPTSLKCAACGCHRNFHRRDPEEPTHVTDYHHPPPPPPPPQPRRSRSPNSESPPPISSSYYPSAPHMLLALSTGLSGPSDNHLTANTTAATMNGGGGGRKRNRTKFSKEQKEKMYLFSERLGWKMQKRDEGLVEEFCNEIGVEKGVLKVWMHNNKNTYGKRDFPNGSSNNDNNNNNDNELHANFNYNHQNDGSSVHVTTNCSSSSS